MNEERKLISLIMTGNNGRNCGNIINNEIIIMKVINNNKEAKIEI